MEYRIPPFSTVVCDWNLLLEAARRANNYSIRTEEAYSSKVSLGKVCTLKINVMRLIIIMQISITKIGDN